MSRELFTEVYKRRIDLVGVVQVLQVEPGVLHNTLYMSGSGLLKDRSSRCCPSTPSRTRSTPKYTVHVWEWFTEG